MKMREEKYQEAGENMSPTKSSKIRQNAAEEIKTDSLEGR